MKFLLTWSDSYLVLLKPPVRELALDALEDLYQGSEEAKAPIKKLAGKLAAFRPGVFQGPAKAQAASTPIKTELPVMKKPSPPQEVTGTPVQPAEASDAHVKKDETATAIT